MEGREEETTRMEKSKSTNLAFFETLEEEISLGKYPVYLQPQVSLATGKVVGAEALIRKVMDDGTLCAPDSFVPLYEKEGTIELIDLYVLEEMVKLLKAHEDKLSETFSISVNLSRVTLRKKNIISKLKNICRENGVAPCKIYIEITETIDVMAMKELITLSKEIKNAGFKLSLDDFGNDYSNAMILANVEFDEVKIDKSLVLSATENSKAKSIISIIINMCKGFDAHIVAEGIETKEMLEVLKAFNCDYGQGYYFSKPIPIEEFLEKYIR